MIKKNFNVMTVDLVQFQGVHGRDTTRQFRTRSQTVQGKLCCLGLQIEESTNVYSVCEDSSAPREVKLCDIGPFTLNSGHE